MRGGMFSPGDLAGLLTIIWVLVLRLFRRNIVALWMVALPGVILHELAHWTIAFVTIGRPGFPRFLPKRMGNAWALGRVPIHHPRWYNGGLIGLAPLLLIPLAGLVLHDGIPNTFHWGAAWKFVVVPFVAAECLLECLPSPADWRLARMSAIPLLLLGLAGFLWWKAH